jgi:hypothetical protein
MIFVFLVVPYSFFSIGREGELLVGLEKLKLLQWVHFEKGCNALFIQ